MPVLLPSNWIAPFYLNILHGNYATSVLDDGQREAFNLAVREALQVVTGEQLSRLIGSAWREAITGSWFAGVGRFNECRDQIGARLLASEACFAGQAHAFALACFADDESANFLEQYLDTFLERKDCYYDQAWVMPALMWIDQERNSNRAERFLKEGGLWESFTADKLGGTNAWTIESCRRVFWRSMNYCQEHFKPA